jgi:hypothetical protein
VQCTKADGPDSPLGIGARRPEPSSPSLALLTRFQVEVVGKQNRELRPDPPAAGTAPRRIQPDIVATHEAEGEKPIHGLASW